MRLLVPLLALCAVTFIASFCVLLVLGETSEAAVAPDYSAAAIGGVQYQAVLGRQVDPANPVDARIIKGLPANQRRPGAGHVHRPLHLSAGNPYTYLPSRLRAGAQAPPPYGAPATDNLAAGGQLLLYRVPAWQVSNGLFELAVHNPLHPSAVGYVQF